MEERFEDIFRACFPPIVQYLQSAHGISRQDAEDIASEAFLLMYRKWDTLEQHTRPAMYRWGLQTARNLLKNENRKKNRAPIILSLEQDCAGGLPLPEDGWTPGSDVEKTYLQYVDRIMNSLSGDERELFSYKLDGRMTDREIATQMHISVGTLRTRWSRLRRKLSRDWDDILGES